MEKASGQQLRALLRGTANGNTDDFHRLYQATSAYLFGLALKIVQNKTVAEEVLQDAFVSVWHRAGDYHTERGSVITWLIAIVRYRAIDALRQQRSRGAAETTTVDTATIEVTTRYGETIQAEDDLGPMATAIAAQDSQQLRHCIRRLSRSQMQSVSLAFFQGLTHQELSDSLALPLGTIKSRLRRSLRRLKQCLADLGLSNEISSGTR